MGYLNNDGLLYLWSKITSKFATKKEVEDEIKEITDSMGSLGYGDMLKTVYDSNNNGVVDNAEKVNGHTVAVDVPADAKFTDTVYEHPTTAGNKHIPSGGSSGQILEYSASGTAKWVNPYSHPTGDGNLHVPATGTSNNGKVLKAGSTAGSLSWGTLGKSDVGLGNVDNTSDANKPVSTAQQTALDGKVDKVTGKGLSTNDYTTDEKTKLGALPTNATLESTYAKKSDLTNVYKYKGSDTDQSKLPTSGQTVGDVYDIQSASNYGAAGMNVAWNGTTWDSLGEVFTINSITNAEIDSVCV